MNLDRFLERHIFRILSEQADDGEERTGQRTRGRSKKAVAQTKVAAIEQPAELMKRLGIGKASGNNDIEKLFSILEQAQSGEDAMQEAYGEPSAHKHQSSGREGVRVPFSIIPTKEARRYLEYTVLGAINAGAASFSADVRGGSGIEGIQVEPLGQDILIYFSRDRNSWHLPPGFKPKPKAKEDETE